MEFVNPSPKLRWAASSLVFACFIGLVGCSSSDNNRSGPTKIGTLTPSSPSSSSSSSASSSSGTTVTSPFRDAQGNPVFVEANIVNQPLEPHASTAVHLNFTNRNGNTVQPVGTGWKATSECIRDGLAEIVGPITNENQISFSYTTFGCVGSDVVTFTTPDFPSFSYSSEIFIEDKVSFISWESTEPGNIAIAGSGGPERSTITFRLNGIYGSSVAGQRVTFRIEGLAGDTIRLVETTGISGSDGLVRAHVLSGSMPNVVTVVARHEESGAEALSGGLVISTGLPSANHFHIGLDKNSLNAWNKLNTPEASVTVVATDRVGNPVVDGTAINFVSIDGGYVTPSCTTENGTCSVQWKPDGREPANGRARIFATVKGTEDFIDRNGNNIFDDGDTFDATHDLGEPFLSRDYSENYQPDDYFIDTNRNKVRDDGDGLWNGLNCQHTSLCSPDVKYVDLAAITQLFISQGNNPTICSTGTFASPVVVPINSTRSLTGLYLSDGNINAENQAPAGCAIGNPLPSGTQISFSTTAGTLEGITSWTVEDIVGAPTGPYGVTLKGGSTATTGTLTLRVSVPDEQVREFYWDVTIQ